MPVFLCHSSIKNRSELMAHEQLSGRRNSISVRRLSIHLVLSQRHARKQTQVVLKFGIFNKPDSRDDVFFVWGGVEGALTIVFGKQLLKQKIRRPGYLAC